MSRVILVTGCTTGGIGYALAQEFAHQGCIVYATSRRVETMADFENPGIHKLALDVTSDENIENVVQKILAKEGKLDVVVNNAGMICPGPLIDNSMDSIKKTFDTNTFAILRVAKVVIPEMAKRRQGVIVNIGSIVGQVHVFSPRVKYGIQAYLPSLQGNTLERRVLSMECRPFGIKVFHVAPGAVKSNIAETGASNFSLAPNSLYKSFLANIMDRIYSSQGPHSMPAEVFAREVVTKTLQKTPPLYLCLGGQSLILTILTWLPRAMVMGIMWRRYSKKL